MENSQPIGVFDSGLGGLTVVRHLIKHLPHEKIIYFGDTARVPYGTRTDETILRYSMQDANFLLSKDVKMIVVACGTASSVAGKALSEMLPLPFEEMIAIAAEAAVATTKNGQIAVLGTPATIRSHSHETAIHRLLPNAKVFPVACPLFVPLVEQGFFQKGNAIAIEVAKEYLSELAKTDIDTVVLGCTHYPLLLDIIAQALPKVTIIDPGEALAGKVKALLTQKNMCGAQGGIQFFVSDRPDDFERFASYTMPSLGFYDVQQVSVEGFEGDTISSSLFNTSR